MAEKLITVKEAVALFPTGRRGRRLVGEKVIRKALQSGDLKGSMVSGCWFTSEEAVLRWAGVTDDKK